MSHEEIREDQENIAIVGIAVRMPGAPNLEAFWQNLRDGVEAVSLFSEEEMLASAWIWTPSATRCSSRPKRFWTMWKCSMRRSSAFLPGKPN